MVEFTPLPPPLNWDRLRRQPILRGCSDTSWTYRTEPAITHHLLYLLVRKGVIPALSGVRDGGNREENAAVSVRIDLFWHFKGTMTSYLSFRAAGP
jgi:hypothetical protein